MKLFERNFLREIYITNKEKCLDLFGNDYRSNEESIFVEFFKFASEAIMLYKPNAFSDNWQATPEEQQDVKEMLEAIIDTIHYAKCKGSKRK